MGFFKLIPYLLIGLFWYAYASMGATPCERMERGAAPIRGLMDGVSWAISPWVGPDTKFEVLKQQLWLERKIRELAARQVYRSDLVTLGCVPPPGEQAVDAAPLNALEKMGQNAMDNEVVQRVTETVKSYAESGNRVQPAPDSQRSQLAPVPSAPPPAQEPQPAQENTIQFR